MLLIVGSKVQLLLRFFDLFSYSTFIRYKGESEFKTATGGFFSLIVLIIFAVLFTNIGIKTVRRQIVSSSFQVGISAEPESTTVHLKPDQFMFAVGVLKVELNNPQYRMFDVQMSQISVSSGFNFIASKTIPMEPCTNAHFSMSQGIKKSFSQNPQSVNWVCPKIGQSFQIFGKFSSDLMNYVQVQIKKCNPDKDPTRPCVSQDQIKLAEAINGPFFAGFLFSNPLINPGNINYFDYYFQDSNYMAFTSYLGAHSSIFIQDYEIVTDESILPFTQSKTQQGIAIPEPFKNTHFLVNADLLVNMMIYKSSSSTSYSRSFYKIDEFFSYIGGLVGVILSGMFLLASYNQFTFQHDLASHLYKIDSSIPSPNLWTFAKQQLYSLFKNCLPSQKFKQIDKSLILKQEMQKQLDLSLILSRILFLERSVQKIFQRGQFEMMHLAKKLKIQRARKMRQHLNLRKYFIKQMKKKDMASKSYSSLNIQSQISKDVQSSSKININISDESEDSNSEDSVDSDIQKNSKTRFLQFKWSLEGRNLRSGQIVKEVDQNLLNYFHMQLRESQIAPSQLIIKINDDEDDDQKQEQKSPQKNSRYLKY